MPPCFKGGRCRPSSNRRDGRHACGAWHGVQHAAAPGSLAAAAPLHGRRCPAPRPIPLCCPAPCAALPALHAPTAAPTAIPACYTPRSLPPTLPCRCSAKQSKQHARGQHSLAAHFGPSCPPPADVTPAASSSSSSCSTSSSSSSCRHPDPVVCGGSGCGRRRTCVRAPTQTNSWSSPHRADTSKETLPCTVVRLRAVSRNTHEHTWRVCQPHPTPTSPGLRDLAAWSAYSAKRHPGRAPARPAWYAKP